jgi:low affinity Fe/Cu permease
MTGEAMDVDPGILLRSPGVAPAPGCGQEERQEAARSPGTPNRCQAVLAGAAGSEVPVPAPDERGASRQFGSRVLSAADRWASRPLTGLAVVAVAVAWIALSAAAGFPERLEQAFEVLVAALTLAMLFVVQHTQARLQHATQRKLDEILHALPDARDALVRLEHGSDEELRAAGEDHRDIRRSATRNDSRP